MIQLTRDFVRRWLSHLAQDVRYAIRTLFRPYIDLKLARKAGAFDWIAQPTHSR